MLVSQPLSQSLPYVKHLSNMRLTFVFALSWSSICPIFVLKIQPLSSENPTYVLTVQLMSSFCLLNLPKTTRKWEQNLVVSVVLLNLNHRHLIRVIATGLGKRKKSSISTSVSNHATYAAHLASLAQSRFDSKHRERCWDNYYPRNIHS